MNRLYTLQSVRGLAALSVVLFHATGLLQVYFGYSYLFGIFKFGDLGVDLFFVLSGFVIYYIHAKDIGRNEKAKIFFLKRFVRVYPIYWFLLIFVIPVYFIVPSFGAEEVTSVINILKSIILLPQPMEFNPLVVAWSLSHEILFYIMFGILIALRIRISFPIVLIWITLSAVFFLTSNFFWEDLSLVFKFLFSPFNLEFLMGVLIAHLILINKIKYGKKLVLIGMFSFLIAWINKNYEIFDFHRIIEYGLPSAILIYGLIVCEKNKQIKIPKVFIYLGDASYSIYLTHAPLLSLINKVFISLNLYKTGNYFLVTTIMVLATVVFGCLFHTLIEQPLLKYMNSKIISKQNKILKVQLENV